jgi:hypothetical protein
MCMTGEFRSSSNSVGIISIRSGRDTEWQGLHPVQRSSGPAMGQS